MSYSKERSYSQAEAEAEFRKISEKVYICSVEEDLQFFLTTSLAEAKNFKIEHPNAEVKLVTRSLKDSSHIFSEEVKYFSWERL